MRYDVAQDSVFKEIAREVSSSGFLEDAWVIYKGERWFPKLIKDRQTNVRGFEINQKGKWGAKNADSLPKNKHELEEFLTKFAEGSISPTSTIRCRRLSINDSDGRSFDKPGLSIRLNQLIDRMKGALQIDDQLVNLATTDFQPAEDSSDIAVSSTIHDNQLIGLVDGDDQKGTGYEPDADKRRAVELYAVKLASEFYASRGYEVEEMGKPYDLLCTKDTEELHVEVKGSRSSMSAIIVTRNEVADARDERWRSDLFLVDGIELGGLVDGIYVPIGGRCRRKENWSPNQEDLTEIQFRYTLPPIPNAE